MEKITVNASRKYDVYIGSDIIDMLNDIRPGNRCIVVTDSNLICRYLDDIQYKVGNTATYVIPAGEESKNMENLAAILEFFAEEQLTRSDYVVAFGGGVVGDITGLAASLYMRGIPFVQIPTTLMAAVDSSVGGKCAVDLKNGKNLAGVFAQPSAVICDTDMLKALPDSEFANGMAEVIKYGIGFDRGIFCMASHGGREIAEKVIPMCVKIKRDIVEADEFDRSERQKLNLGHTVGHAIEKCSGYTIPHGAAVAMGLSVICRAFIPYEADKVDLVLEQNGLSVKVPYTADEIYEAAALDKKRSGDTISLVVPERIGQCTVWDFPLGEHRYVIERGLK